MGKYDITTTETLVHTAADYSEPSKTTDNIDSQDENKWRNKDFHKYYGFYDEIGAYKAAINSYATWTTGQGYTTESARDKVILDHITGWGEDTFQSILWGMIVVKKFGGDSYSEIIRDEETGTLINLKPLDSGKMSHVTNKKGRLIRYDYLMSDGEEKGFKPNDILHFCNDRILDEPHGTATTVAVEWVIGALEEARRDYRRVAHRSTVRILYVEEEDTGRRANLKKDYAEAIKSGDVLILPGNAKDYQFQDLNVPPVTAFLAWIGYLENHFYQALGVPKVVLGGTQENTEASAKVGVLVYEPVWVREISELEADIWNQLGIKIKINKQPSMMDNVQQQESKNNAQTGFQPNDTQVNKEGER